jgi:hypothetical protein
VVVAAALPVAAGARAEVVDAVGLARPLRQPRRPGRRGRVFPAGAASQPQPPHRPCEHTESRGIRAHQQESEIQNPSEQQAQKPPPFFPKHARERESRAAEFRARRAELGLESSTVPSRPVSGSARPPSPASLGDAAAYCSIVGAQLPEMLLPPRRSIGAGIVLDRGRLAAARESSGKISRSRCCFLRTPPPPPPRSRSPYARSPVAFSA